MKHILSNDTETGWDFADAPIGGSSEGQLENEQLVRCIMLDFGYTSQNVKNIQILNDEAERQAAELGIDAVRHESTFKEGGVMGKVAILQKQVNGGWVDTFGIDKKDGLIEPSYATYTQITMLSLPLIYSNRWSLFTKGLNYIDKDGKPRIKGFLPATFPAKDWTTGIVDEDKEATRVQEWQDQLKIYSNLSEEQAHNYLLKHLAQRFILVEKKDDAPGRLMRPRTGVLFEARIRRKDGSRLFDLERFTWNKAKEQYDVYGTLYATIDDESVDMAQKIILLRDGNKAKRSIDKAANIKKFKEYADEVPF